MVQYEDIQFQLIDTPPLKEDYMEPLMGNLMHRADMLMLMLDIQTDPLNQYIKTTDMVEHFRIYSDESRVPQDLTKPHFIKKMIVVLNKMDTRDDEEVFELFLELSETHLPCMGISIETGHHLDALVRRIYDLSGVIRVYTKSPGKAPDMKAPFVLSNGSTLGDLARKIHKDFSEKLKFAKVWGQKVYDGQMVQRDYVLQDGDVVEIHM